jgi:hypothetical protein
VVAADRNGFVNVESLSNAELKVTCGVDGDYASFPELDTWSVHLSL